MGAPVDRSHFEKLIKFHLDSMQSGLSRRAKRDIGGAWTFIIGKMYDRRADDLTSENISERAVECAEAITKLLTSLESRRS
jgi:hypothetical protein